MRLGNRWSLERGHISVGRGSETSIVLDADSVSRRHARESGSDQISWISLGFRLYAAKRA